MPVELENIVDSWLNRDTKEAKNLLKLQMHVPKFADLEREKYCPTRQKTIFTHHGIMSDLLMKYMKILNKKRKLKKNPMKS